MQSLSRTSNLFRSVFNCPDSNREAIIVPLERLHGFTCSSACLATLYFGADFHPSPKTTYVIICSFDSTRAVSCRGVCIAGSPSLLVQYQDLSIIHYCSSSSILPSGKYFRPLWEWHSSLSFWIGEVTLLLSLPSQICWIISFARINMSAPFEVLNSLFRLCLDCGSDVHPWV